MSFEGMFIYTPSQIFSILGSKYCTKISEVTHIKIQNKKSQIAFQYFLLSILAFFFLIEI